MKFQGHNNWLISIKIFIIISLFVITAVSPAPKMYETHIIDPMDDKSEWIKYPDDLGGIIETSKVPGINGNAIELNYDIKQKGWVQITKKINPDILNGTKAFGFSYKGTGASNTLEFKLSYEDNNSSPDTTFICDFHASTNTNDTWTPVNVSIYDISCRWPYNMCNLYKNRLDLSKVDRIEFAVSNKPDEGDVPGKGKIAIDDVKAFVEPVPPIAQPGGNDNGENGNIPEAIIGAIALIIVAIIGYLGNRQIKSKKKKS
jgi:hypothetical protein